MRNYEALTLDEKALVPDKYYLTAKNLVKGTPEHALVPHVKEASLQKICRGFVEIIRQVMNKGKLTLLTRPDRRPSANPRTHNYPTPSVVKEILSHLRFLCRP